MNSLVVVVVLLELSTPTYLSLILKNQNVYDPTGHHLISKDVRVPFFGFLVSEKYICIKNCSVYINTQYL